MDIVKNIQELIDDRGDETLDASLIELRRDYDAGVPYVAIPKINGICFAWTPQFINGILIAMATDALKQFTTEEQKAWYQFVAFQDFHSTSTNDVDEKGISVGATNPDQYGNSYVVMSDANDNEGRMISPEGWRKTIISDNRALTPEGGIMKEVTWASLDRLLMDLLNCRYTENCDPSWDYTSVNQCTAFKERNPNIAKNALFYKQITDNAGVKP